MDVDKVEGRSATAGRPARACGIDFASVFLPRTPAGGDFFDVWMLEGRLGVVIGEISGEDVGRAGIMARAAGMLRQADQTPWSVFRRLNDLLTERELPGVCITLGYLLLDPESRTARVLSAGHPAPILVTRDGEAKTADVEGVALGLLKGAQFADTLREETLDLARIARILLYTCGGFPERAIVDGILTSRPRADSAEIVDRLVAAARESGPAGDLTVLCLTMEAPSKGSDSC